MAATPKLAAEPPTDYARSVTVWSDAGGVGKTTTTLHTADELGQHGRDVLVIDLDPQGGCLTHHAGFESTLNRERFKLTPALFNDTRSIDENIIVGDSYDLNFDIVPAHSELEDFGAQVAMNLGPAENPMLVLRQALAEAGLPAAYDTILIDAPATRGRIVENAIAATRNVLMPVEMSEKGLASVSGLYSYVSDKQRALRRQTGNDDISLSVIGVVPNAGAKNGQLGATERASLRDLYHDDNFDVVPFYVPDLNLFSDTWRERQTLREFIDDSETRDLRAAEQRVPDYFQELAVLVEQGTVDAIELTEEEVVGTVGDDDE